MSKEEVRSTSGCLLRVGDGVWYDGVVVPIVAIHDDSVVEVRRHDGTHIHLGLSVVPLKHCADGLKCGCGTVEKIPEITAQLGCVIRVGDLVNYEQHVGRRVDKIRDNGTYLEVTHDGVLHTPFSKNPTLRHYGGCPSHCPKCSVWEKPVNQFAFKPHISDAGTSPSFKLLYLNGDVAAPDLFHDRGTALKKADEIAIEKKRTVCVAKVIVVVEPDIKTKVRRVK